ncbi:winged helix-turn-helix domain-containing protein [Thalassomonas sp. M1454]|uniref:winged helix-turn-helix domain-containing protein n=1 Tax=Thalassomonas sp. M1454 TaxID=2594477 RepID=UPI00117EC746|nr:winged helix-turn-helix domain-containing protein [Thalassomonas sp. M1454]TRX56949.1 hypothetical protein FNN08_05395 [Thalassomonas sp. M1454]
MIDLPYQYYQIGRFKIDCKALTVANNEVSIKLPVKVFELLKLFIISENQTVLIETAIEKIWDGNEGVGKRGFPNTIWHLRKTFTDLGAEPSEIFTTVRKVGYIMVETSQPINTVDENVRTAESKFNLNVMLKSLMFVCIFVMFFIGLYVFINQPNQHQTNFIDNPEPLKQTNYQGLETHPAVSHDGNYLAFRWVQDKKKGQLFIKDLVQDDVPLRLLSTSSFEEASPTWSPNDNSIAYIRYEEDGDCEIRVKHLVTNQDELIDSGCIYNANRIAINWAPDGDHIAYTKMVNDSVATFEYNLTTKNIKQLSFPKQNERDVAVVYSKNSKQIALIREDYQIAQLIVIDEKGAESIILDNQISIIGLEWDHDRNEIYTSYLKSAEHRIYKYNVESQQWLDVNKIAKPANISMNEATGQLFFTRYSTQEYIIRKSIEHNEVISTVSSSSRDMFGSYSPINEHIIFLSNRAGNWDVWVKTDSESINLTKGSGQYYMPSWSPINNQYIVAGLTPYSKNYQLYLGDFANKTLTHIPLSDLEPKNPRWSFDGKSVYFIATRDGRSGIFNIDIESRKVRQVTYSNEISVVEGGDGLLYASRNLEHGIWQIDPKTNKSIKIIDDLLPKDFGSYFWQDNAIFYISRNEIKDMVKKHTIDGTTEIIHLYPANTIKRYLSLSPVDIDSYIITLNNQNDADIYSVKVISK